MSPSPLASCSLEAQVLAAAYKSFTGRVWWQRPTGLVLFFKRHQLDRDGQLTRYWPKLVRALYNQGLLERQTAVTQRARSLDQKTTTYYQPSEKGLEFLKKLDIDFNFTGKTPGT